MSLSWVPEGPSGTLETVHAITRLAREGASSPRVILYARRLATECPQNDRGCIIDGLARWLDQRWHYVPDPKVQGLRDTLRTAASMLDEVEQYGTITGDCDEAATLAAALSAAAGFPTRLVVASFDGQTYRHIYTEARLGDGWVELDPARPWEASGVPPARALLVPI